MLPRERLSLSEFHGHLGPYLYLGYRMGKLALLKLKARGKKLHVLVKSGLATPLSCMIDGIQFSTSCTLGKGNISVADEKKAEAVFKGEHMLTIVLKENVKRSIDDSKANDELVQSLYDMKDEELFEVDIDDS